MSSTLEPTAQDIGHSARKTNDTVCEQEEKGEVAVVDEVAEFNMYDSDRFISAVAKCVWTQEPDSDDPNHCSTESENDELDEVDTEEYITEVMNNELKLPSGSGEDLDDSDYSKMSPTKTGPLAKT
ncbi:hypothetical protein PC117_g16393 [Phytophthora cactorum]|uniref:Uncharacterized protein n=1 Tax=Phytophthora cactorum TaxID=29920 RepID=A0A8T1CG11_9STRA|nr:hypothetical protein PC117_g16393 [Phytophthora cactorum]